VVDQCLSFNHLLKATADSREVTGEAELVYPRCPEQDIKGCTLNSVKLQEKSLIVLNAALSETALFGVIIGLLCVMRKDSCVIPNALYSCQPVIVKTKSVLLR
jgi:hypothetical protein